MFPKHAQPMILLLMACFVGTHAYALKNKAMLYDGGGLTRQTACGSASLLQDFFVANSEHDPAAGQYRLIGGISLSKPSCVSWGAKRVDCFIRSESSRVYHWHKDNGAYYKWEDLTGTILGDIESVSRQEGYIDVVVTGSDTATWVNTYNTNWSGFKRIPSQIIEEPSCIKRSSSIVDCVARGVDNQAYAVEAVDGKWGQFVKIGGLFRDPLAVSRRSDDIYDVWGIGVFSELYHNWWDGKWHQWEKLGGRYKGRPSVVSWDVNRIDVFVLGMYNHLRHLVWTDGKVQQEDLGGTFQDVPSCVNIGETIHCFGTGPKSYLYRKSYVDGKWSAWINSYGAFLDSPSCVVSDLEEKEVSCYMRGFDRGIVELVYKF